MENDILRISLLDLWSVLGTATDRILLGGGYGLYLKQLHLTQLKTETLISIEHWPTPRSTQDLDIFLTAELVSNANDMSHVRNALDQLGYTVIPGAEYLQFSRTASDTHVIKIDLLTAQIDILKHTDGIKANDRRARPITNDRPKLHAHPTDGALHLTQSSLSMDVSGSLSNGDLVKINVQIPHPFSYLLMKLTAYRDRKNDKIKDFGQHHAFDIFRIMAMLTQKELAELIEYVTTYQANTQLLSCRQVALCDFTGATTEGVIAMRRHHLWRNDDELEDFIGVISEIFSHHER